MIRKLLLMFLVFYAHNIYALNDVITGKNVELFLRGEYDRAYGSNGEISGTGTVELFSLLTIQGGIAVGIASDTADIKTSVSFRYAPFMKFPLHFSTAYIYNGLPGYEAHSHTIIPVISFNGRRAGVAAGLGFRFTSYFGEAPIFESIFSFSGYFNFINNEKLCIGINVANYNNFVIRNMGAYSSSLYGMVCIRERWMVIGILEFLQSGGTGLSTNFYGISFQGGVRFTW